MRHSSWTRRQFLSSAASGLGFMAFASGLAGLNCRGRKRPPNFVLIFTDDQGYADVGVFGAKGYTTPNLDGMAEQGMRFTDFHVSQAVCSASRASLLTGCYAERVGIQGALMPWSRIGLHPEEDTIADVLKRRGYACGMVGKWHLGHLDEFLPLRQGFDEYLGLPYSNDMWPVDFDGRPVTQGNKIKYPPLPLIDGDQKVDEIRTLEDQATLTTRYTGRALRFIRNHRNRPFFLYFAHSMPHVPLGVSDKFRGKSEQGMYGDVIMEIDWSVGEILRTLQEFGLDQDTLVIFASDNGPWMNFGNHAGSALPLREGKGAMWEGGCRVPCIMRWPGQIPAGETCQKLAASIDVLPTLAYLAGADLPSRPIDGVNIWPLMQNDPTANPRDQFYFYYGHELVAVREGDWKLTFPHTYRSYRGVEPGKDGWPGPYASATCGLELYNLREDISETRDVAIAHPKIVERLQLLAEKARTELGDRLQGRRGSGERPPGRAGEHKQVKVKHLAVGASLQLKNPWHKKYPASGAHALIDGQRGSDDFNDGCWQGFEAVDLLAEIDLGVSRDIVEIACGFLSDQNSWIFWPAEVTMAVAGDDGCFRPVRTWREPVQPVAGVESKDYYVRIEASPVRRVRITAKNVSHCPDWHPGSGGKAWLFVDEIVVR